MPNPPRMPDPPRLHAPARNADVSPDTASTTVCDTSEVPATPRNPPAAARRGPCRERLRTLAPAPLGYDCGTIVPRGPGVRRHVRRGLPPSHHQYDGRLPASDDRRHPG